MDYPGKVITKTQVTPTQTSASGNWTLDDQAAAIKNNNWPVALVPNPISKSLRFNSADTAYLNRTFGTSTNQSIFTYSVWIKLGRAVEATINYGELLSGYTASSDTGFGEFTIYNGKLRFSGWATSWRDSTQVFRDPSSWYHVVLAVDTTQATAANRIKMYVNGSEITAFSTNNNPTQNSTIGVNNNSTTGRIGQDAPASSSRLFDGYMAEANFIDGQALTPSSFGMTNPQTGQWIPLKYSGTYGTNGFYLNFKDATSTTTLGYDYSGNANNWTTNNFSVTAGSGNDSLTDVPTPWVAYNTTGDVGGVIRGNYATLNPLFYNSLGSDLRNGNLDGYGITSATAPYYRNYPSTIAVSSGKWFCELTIGNVANGFNLGIASAFGTDGLPTTYYSYNFWDQTYIVSGSSSAYGAKASNGDVIGMAVDLDNGTITWYRNGSSQGQKTGIAAGTYFLYTNMGFNSPAQNGSMNFGQRPFAYTPPAGFRSLCTTNLPATTIGFGLTNQGDDYFDVSLYTGNGTAIASGGKVVSGVSFQPDFVWIKSRTQGTTNYTGYHNLYDAVRGANKYLTSSTTEAESTLTQGLASFNSDGFTVGSASSSNYNGDSFVAWNWKANGAGSTNTAGTITSTVSANTTAGFSISTYTGNGSSSQTVGHGLGVALGMVIIKTRSNSDNWRVWHTSLTSGQTLTLNSTAAQAASGFWPSNPSTSVVYLGTDSSVNSSTWTYVMYSFAPVAGYSAFGSYVANGSTDGVFVFCGFRPRFFLVKDRTSANDWLIYDTARNPYNLAGLELFPNSSAAEATGNRFDILSNGFKIRGSGGAHNTNGNTYIYAAFAEAPFQFANAR